jgi:hypothetical protein
MDLKFAQLFAEITIINSAIDLEVMPFYFCTKRNPFIAFCNYKLAGESAGKTRSGDYKNPIQKSQLSNNS